MRLILIAKNTTTGDYVADLGMRGDYPYSSKVGREVCLGGQVEAYWYATEINPRGRTQLELDTQEWIKQVAPTLGVQLMCGPEGRFVQVNQVGGGLPLPVEARAVAGSTVWTEKRGVFTDCPHVLKAIDALVAQSDAYRAAHSDDDEYEYDYDDEEDFSPVVCHG